MKTLKRRELEKGINAMISTTLTILEDLHIVHSKKDVQDLINTNLPIGKDLTLPKLLVNIYEILRPVIDLARKQFPHLFHIIDWCEMIVRKLLKV